MNALSMDKAAKGKDEQYNGEWIDADATTAAINDDTFCKANRAETMRGINGSMSVRLSQTSPLGMFVPCM